MNIVFYNPLQKTTYAIIVFAIMCYTEFTREKRKRFVPLTRKNKKCQYISTDKSLDFRLVRSFNM